MTQKSQIWYQAARFCNSCKYPWWKPWTKIIFWSQTIKRMGWMVEGYADRIPKYGRKESLENYWKERFTNWKENYWKLMGLCFKRWWSLSGKDCCTRIQSGSWKRLSWKSCTCYKWCNFSFGFSIKSIIIIGSWSIWYWDSIPLWWFRRRNLDGYPRWIFRIY